jgi:DNA (cytosine-5)-methyltransferase 1
MLGFVRAGFRVLASYDRKTIVAKNAALNFPDIPHRLQDIVALTPQDVRDQIAAESVDVVFGGPPCQGFSIFGNRRFVNKAPTAKGPDERNELTLAYIDMAVALAPKAIFMENVKGMLSASRGSSRYLDIVEARLKRAGYSVQHQLVNCADYGVPQTRERLLLVAVRPDIDFVWPSPKYLLNPKSWQRPYSCVGDVIV